MASMKGTRFSRIVKCSVVTSLMSFCPAETASDTGAVPAPDQVVREYGLRLNDFIIDLNLATAELKADGSVPGRGVGSLTLPCGLIP